MTVATAEKTTSPNPKHNIEAMREAFYDRISKKDMAPLWKVMKSVVTNEPVTRCAPHVWHYNDIKSLVMESGGLITAEEAERRCLSWKTRRAMASPVLPIRCLPASR